MERGMGEAVCFLVLVIAIAVAGLWKVKLLKKL